jgi:caa(3)-type oxidase subunit IV
MRTPADTAPDTRRHLVTFASQLLLMLATVAVSRLGLGVRLGTTAVMLLAAVNATVVAVVLMGVRRDGLLVRMLAVLTLVVMVGLLVWPAWDVAARVRAY